MRSLNSIGLGLSLTFACLLLALVGEIYYLLWWKRRSWNRRTNQDDCCTPTSSARQYMYMFCFHKFSNTQSLSGTANHTVSDMFPQQQNENENNSSSNKDLLLLKSDDGVVGSDRLVGFHDMNGPPKLLFTIKEETREDLEAEDGNGRFSSSSSSTRSLTSDMNSAAAAAAAAAAAEMETPYLTPLSSPSMFTPPLTPLNSSYYTHLGFNPLFESSSDAELRRLKASPPPKFKFLQEAEGKFQRRRMMEMEVDQMDQFNNGYAPNEADNQDWCKRDESMITIIVAKGHRS